MEGKDQKLVDPSTLSSKCGKPIANVSPNATQPVAESENRSTDNVPNQSHPDPTRFGDWVYAGRCIDF